jgi:methionyl-tRNA formyltransferase
MKFGLILSNTNRSKVYIKLLLKNSLRPKEIFFYSKKKDKFFMNLFIKKNLNYCFLKTNNINDNHVIKVILKSKLKNLIYSGYSGQIINSNILTKKNLIHCHPGRLPNYRGSTTIFYSLIKEMSIACSVFKMNKKIDMGEIYYIKKFKPPKNLHMINNKFDDNIRALTIINFLKKNKKIIRNKKYINEYYIAHPIIRRIALNKKSLFFIKKLNYY